MKQLAQGYGAHEDTNLGLTSKPLGKATSHAAALCCSSIQAQTLTSTGGGGGSVGRTCPRPATGALDPGSSASYRLVLSTASPGVHGKASLDKVTHQRVAPLVTPSPSDGLAGLRALFPGREGLRVIRFHATELKQDSICTGHPISILLPLLLTLQKHP